MSNEQQVQEAVERAKRMTQDRLDAVADVARARDAAERIKARHEAERKEMEDRHKSEAKEVENADVSAYNHAVKIGWSAYELRQIGYSEPAKKRRTQRRRTARARSAETNSASGDQSPQSNTSPGPDDSE